MGHFVEPNYQKWKVLFFRTLYGKRSRDDELDLITQKILLVSSQCRKAATVVPLTLKPKEEREDYGSEIPYQSYREIEERDFKNTKNLIIFVRQNSTSVTMNNWKFFAVIVSTTTNWTVVIVTSKT